MNPEVITSTLPERLLALGTVALIGLITFVLARWIGRRLKGSTRLGLRGLDRLAAPVTLFVLALSATLVMAPLAIDPELISFAAEVLAIFAGFWLVSRGIDVFWRTGKQSARVRHHPPARAALTSVRHLGKGVLWVSAITSIAVKLGAADQLYLVLGGLGAALAFAARDPIRNAIAFVTMLVDPPFRLGDRVRLEEFRGGVAAEGLVLKMTPSSVTIESRGGTQVVVSNVRVNELRVENLSAADRRRLVLVLTVPRELSTEALRAACDEIDAALRTHPLVSDRREPHVWISGGEAGLQLKSSLWLRKASSRREAQRELVLLMRERLERHLRPRAEPKARTHRLAPA